MQIKTKLVNTSQNGYYKKKMLVLRGVIPKKLGGNVY